MCSDCDGSKKESVVRLVVVDVWTVIRETVLLGGRCRYLKHAREYVRRVVVVLA